MGDPNDNCADDRRHLRLCMDFRAHLSLRCLDVRAKTWSGATGETGTHEIEALEVLDSLGGLGANKYPACRALVVKLKPYRLPHIA